MSQLRKAAENLGNPLTDAETSLMTFCLICPYAIPRSDFIIGEGRVGGFLSQILLEFEVRGHRLGHKLCWRAAEKLLKCGKARWHGELPFPGIRYAWFSIPAKVASADGKALKPSKLGAVNSAFSEAMIFVSMMLLEVFEPAVSLMVLP